MTLLTFGNGVPDPCPISNAPPPTLQKGRCKRGDAEHVPVGSVLRGMRHQPVWADARKESLEQPSAKTARATVWVKPLDPSPETKRGRAGTQGLEHTYYGGGGCAG